MKNAEHELRVLLRGRTAIHETLHGRDLVTLEVARNGAASVIVNTSALRAGNLREQ